MKAPICVMILTAASACAGPVLIQLDTASLPAGTYYLDFQLIGSDNVAANNTAAIGDLNLGGGAFVSADLTNSSGAFPNYSTTDTDFFNAVLIGFTRGSSMSFQLTLSNNFSGTGTPDTFSLAVLDEAFNSIVSTGLSASLVVNLDGSSQPVIRTFAADPVFGSVQPTAGIPEPGTLALLLLGASGLWIARLRSQPSISHNRQRDTRGDGQNSER